MHDQSLRFSIARPARSPRRAPMLAALLGIAASVAGCPGPTMTGDNPDMSSTAPDMATPPRYGMVRIASTTVTAGTTTINSSAATAVFVDPSQQGAACQRQTQGECTLYSCEGTSFSAPHAGAIAISGGTQNVSLNPRSDGSYEPYVNSSSNVFPSGQALSLSAAGQTVPAFSTNITPMSASPFALTMPDGSRATLVFAVPKAQDYQLTWTALGAGTKVAAELIQNPDSNRSVTLSCVFDGARGNGTFPSALLGRFQTTNGQLGVGAFLIGPATTASVKQGAWDISVTAISGGRAGTASLQ